MNTIGTKEAADILGLSLNTVRTYVRDGRIRCSEESGHHLRFDRRYIEKMAEERRNAMSVRINFGETGDWVSFASMEDGSGLALVNCSLGSQYREVVSKVRRLLEPHGDKREVPEEQPVNVPSDPALALQRRIPSSPGFINNMIEKGYDRSEIVACGDGIFRAVARDKWEAVVRGFEVGFAHALAELLDKWTYRKMSDEQAEEYKVVLQHLMTFLKKVEFGEEGANVTVGPGDDINFNAYPSLI